MKCYGEKRILQHTMYIVTYFRKRLVLLPAFDSFASPKFTLLGFRDHAKIIDTAFEM